MKKRLILLLVLFQVMFAQSWLDKPAASTVNNADKLMLGQGGITKTLTGEILKAFIGASTITKVNDYYYFQDASLPVNTDYRIFSNGLYLDFERYNGSTWVQQFRIGGSAFVPRFIEILKDVNAEIFVNDGGIIKNIIRQSTYSDGVSVGNAYGVTYVINCDKIISAQCSAVQAWNVIQPIFTTESTGTLFSNVNTTRDIDAFNTEKIRLKGVNLPAGVKIQAKFYTTDDLINPKYENVTDIEFENGEGDDLNLDGTFSLTPQIFGIGNTEVKFQIKTSVPITLLGDTNDGTCMYFEAFDREVEFLEVTNESNVKTQYEANANTNAFTDADKTKLDAVCDGVLPSIDYTLTSHIDGLDVSALFPSGIVRVDATSDIELRSLAGGVHKQLVKVVNLSLKNVKLKNESGSYQMLRVEGDADKTISKYGGLTLMYDGIKGYWYVVGIII